VSMRIKKCSQVTQGQEMPCRTIFGSCVPNTYREIPAQHELGPTISRAAIAMDREPEPVPDIQTLDTEDFSMTQYPARRFAALATTAKKQPRQSRRASGLLFAIASAFCVSGVHAQDNVVNPPLHIDIPTTLERANVVIDYGHAVLNGDAPFGLGDGTPDQMQFTHAQHVSCLYRFRLS